jgi:hypothetical protein
MDLILYFTQSHHLAVVAEEVETMEVLGLPLVMEMLAVRAAVLQWVILERSKLVGLEQQVRAIRVGQELLGHISTAVAVVLALLGLTEAGNQATVVLVYLLLLLALL